MTAMSEPISVVITSFNSAATLDACLASVGWAEQRLVLDSGSTDASPAIAAHHRADFHRQAFAGYARQKQAAVDLARYDWVLLLDSDEALPAGSETLIRAALATGHARGYQLWRREWILWRWQSPRSRLNHYVRLFDRRHARLSDLQVHETVQVEGDVSRLAVVLDHLGQPDIAQRVDKANRYSSLQLGDLRQRRDTGVRWRLCLYSSVAFWRYYLWRGHWREGWAGYVSARIHAFYAFLKYAKLYEADRRD